MMMLLGENLINQKECVNSLRMQEDWRFSHNAQPISGAIVRQICLRLPKEQRPRQRRRLPISAAELRANELARLTDYIPPSITHLRSLTPAPFRNAIALMLERLGYVIVNDPTEGPNLIVTKSNKKLVVFCARPAEYEPVGKAAVGRLHEAIVEQGADSGFYVSAREFTEEARDYEKTAPIKLVDGEMLKKSMQRSMRGLAMPITYDAMCIQCGDVVTHRLDRSKAIACIAGHAVAPTIAMAALMPKEYPAARKAKGKPAAQLIRALNTMNKKMRRGPKPGR